MAKIPKILQGVLWSINIQDIDIQKDKNYIIHQILAYGTWTDLKWLFDTYKMQEVKSVFVNYPSKDYLPSVFKFVTEILLGLEKVPDKRRYVTTYPRIIG